MNRKEMRVSEEAEQGFENEQEKKEYIDKVWDKVDKREKIRKWVRGSCLVAGVAAALIIGIVFRDDLPKSLTERHRGYGTRRGSLSLLEMIGWGVGLLVGEGAARLIIKLMKLEE